MERPNSYAEDTGETSTTQQTIEKVSITLGSPTLQGEGEEWFIIGNYSGTTKASGVGSFVGKVRDGTGFTYGTVAFGDKDTTDYTGVLSIGTTFSYFNFLDALELYADIAFGIQSI